MIATPISTGIAGLDTVLGGGYTPRRLYLVEGLPGSGKTTLSMQFLMNGRDLGERVLYVSLSETEAELREMMASHGWSTEGIEIFEPLAGVEDRIAFTPTLVKRFPEPRMWVLGNLRETDLLADMLRLCGVESKE